MGLLTYNWLKKAMAVQLSMESYAKTFKDKDHQMMIVHGDRHIGPDAGVILAAENPYIHKEVQEYIYELTKPFISDATYHGYRNIINHSQQGYHLLYALVKNPSLSSDVASKIISNFAFLLKEVEKIKNLGSGHSDPFTELCKQFKDKFQPVLYNLSESKVLDSNSLSELIYIFSTIQNNEQNFRYYEKQYFSEFVDNGLSKLTGNTNIEKSERLKIARTFFNPITVGSFVKSKDMDSNTVIGLIQDVNSSIGDDHINCHKFDNYIKTLISIVEYHSPENENLEKLHTLVTSDNFLNHVLKKINTLRACDTLSSLSTERYSEKFLSSVANKTSSEEEKLSFIKRISDKKSDTLLDKYRLVQLCGLAMSTGKVSEEFIDILIKNVYINDFWNLMRQHPQSSLHLFDKIFEIFKQSKIGHGYAGVDNVLWVKKCIQLGLSCETQKMLVDDFTERSKSLLRHYEGSYAYKTTFSSTLLSSAEDNFCYLILKSGHACPEVIRKIMSGHDGAARAIYASDRLKQVKNMLSNLRSQV